MNEKEAQRIYSVYYSTKSNRKERNNVYDQVGYAEGYLEALGKATMLELAIRHRLKMHPFPMSKGEYVTMKYELNKWLKEK